VTLRATIMLGSLVVGLAPWMAAPLAMFANPTLPRAEAWRVAGMVALVLWLGGCVLVGVVLAYRDEK